MKNKLALSIAAALFATAAPAYAVDGIYAGLGAMFHVPVSSEPNISVLNSTPRKVDVTFQAGYGARAAVGYAFPDYRTEIEIGYRKAKLGHINEGAAAGSQGVFDAMANVIFNVGKGAGFQPYLGAGVGGAWAKWSNVQGGPSVQLGGPTGVYDDHSPTALQYQGIAGASFAVGPASEVFVDYRYIGTTGMTFQSTAPVGFTLNEHKDASHNLLVGVRFAFGGL